VIKVSLVSQGAEWGGGDGWRQRKMVATRLGSGCLEEE
jgi:hypothetical protein